MRFIDITYLKEFFICNTVCFERIGSNSKQKGLASYMVAKNNDK